jgi:large subunit ribosomal protein L1
MAKHGKRYIEAAKMVDPEKEYAPLEAAALVKKTATTKFDQTVEVHIRLGVDPRQSEEAVRGTVGLPHGTGKRVRIAVFAQGEKALEATKAGADEVGAADLVAKIDGGWLDFDVAISTPDLMGQVGKLGKVLGRKGLMPNPKAGTITMDLARTISELHQGGQHLGQHGARDCDRRPSTPRRSELANWRVSPTQGRLRLRADPVGRPKIAPWWRRQGDEIRRIAEESV